MKAPRNIVTFLIGLGITLALSYAKAETVYLDAKPSNKISTAQAAKSKQPVFKCEKVKQGPSINPVKVPNSETIWSSQVGDGISNAGEKLADGQQVYRCKSMQMDNETARMKSI